GAVVFAKEWPMPSTISRWGKNRKAGRTASDARPPNLIPARQLHFASLARIENSAMAIHIRRIRRKGRVKPPGSAIITPARAAISGGALVLGFVAGLSLLTYGPEAYSGWREARLLSRASTMLAQQDFDGATHAAQEIVQKRPDSLVAVQILSESSEKQNRPETVAWRAQIARLQPQDLDSQLNLASAPLRFGQLDTARKALEHVAPADRDRAAYHVVAGWLARAQGSDAEVEQHFAAAVEKEPGNDLY